MDAAPPSLSSPERALKVTLRINGLITASAIFAVFMPLPWMHRVHQHLGMGQAPHQPIFEYLARTVSFIYFIHGLLCLLLSTDVRRFGPVITYVGWIELIFAGFVFWIDFRTGMPRIWTLVEAPAIVFFAGLILILRVTSRKSVAR